MNLIKKAACAAIVATACAGLYANGTSYKVTTDISFVSEYVFRGLQFAQNCMQPSIEVSFNDVYVGVWTSIDTDGSMPSNEFDYYAGYSYHLSDAWMLDGGITYYQYPENPWSKTVNLTYWNTYGHTFEGYLGIAGDIKGFSPALYVYRDFDIHSITVQASLGYKVALGESPASVDCSIIGGYVSLDNTSLRAMDIADDNYMYYGADVTLNYQINDTSAAKLGVHVIDTNVDGMKSNFYWSASFSTGF